MRTTLNLLSPKNRLALKTAQVMTFVQTLSMYVAIVAVIIAGALLSLEMLLRNTVGEMAGQSTRSLSEYEVMTQQMRGINDFVDRTMVTDSTFTDWSAVIEAISGAASRGIRFESIRVSPDMTVALNGLAERREDVLAMQRGLERLPFLTDISSPLSNILKQTDLRFEFKMSYSPQQEE